MACEARALSQAKANGAGKTWMPLALFPDLTWQVMENSKYHFIEEVKKNGYQYVANRKSFL